ncbi:MAG TPA: PRC-barrel domain-containing protein [Candidatus Binatia bacterium]|nr:PRC-barrel domain-containing protein [Candidatus Binatia bacterium]
MKKNILVIAIVAAAIPVLAQQDQQSQQQQQQQQASEKSQQELKVSEQEAKQQVTDVNKASKLMGMQVKNKEGEDLGKVKDLVIDFESGKIAYAVMSAGGTFGIGGKLVAVPVQALTLKPGDKALLIDLPKQQLTQAKGFDEQHWPGLDAAQKGQTIGLGSSGSAQGGTGSQTDQSQQSSDSKDKDKDQQQQEK